MVDQDRLADHPRHFDRIVAGVVVILFLLIFAVIARGDQVGVGLRSFSPAQVGSSKTLIQVTFDEAISSANLDQYFSIEPKVAGTFTALNKTVTFQPAVALSVGQEYRVTLRAGLAAASGRQLKQAITWRFTVRAPRIVYLAPAGEPVQNLFAMELSAPGQPQQLTHSSDGVLDYAVLSDGSQIVYSEMALLPGNQDDTTSLYLLDVATGDSRPLYECRAVCLALAWRPDGGAIAFQRVDLNDPAGFSQGAPRIWLYEFATNTAHPLFTDDQILGAAPRWSPDGSRLAFFSGSEGAILIHDFASGKNMTVDTNLDQIGRFSPDGRWLYFPKMVNFPDGNGALHLALADLAGGQPPHLRDLTAPQEPVNDMDAAWGADSQALIVARQPATRGLTDGMSLYQVDRATGAARLLVPDAGNNQVNLSLDPAGDTLLFERVLLGQPEVKSSLWTYDLSTSALKMVVDQATAPAWAP